MTILIRPFKVSDLTAFNSIEPLNNDKRYDPEFAQAIEDSGLAVTGIRNGVIVGCGGCHPVDDVHGEMWLRLSKECLDHKIETLRWLKSGLEIIEQTYPFEQLNATIQCCFERSVKLIEYLGFTLTETKECEGQRWVIYSKRVR